MRSKPTRARRHLSLTAVAVLTVPLVLVACGRSSSKSGGSTTPTGSASSGAPASSAAASAAGDFGTQKAICGKGKPGTTTARGLTASEIRIGVTADPGAAVAPGLEQEFFDTAEGFAKWCNDAGGINGR
jgi:hypothetical protein